MAYKINILTKLLILLLLLTVVPLGILGYFALNDAKDLGYQAAQEAKLMGETALKNSKAVGEIALENSKAIGVIAAEGSTNALNELGANLIKQKAVDVAKQLEIYIKQNPDMTIADLQNDSYFQVLAVQPVGETGYTAITDVESLICRFHASPKIIDLDLHNLADALPGFWGVMSKSHGGVPSEGFYDWKEADGSINQKYMYIAIVNDSVKTADGVVLSVAATTYIDEFNRPVDETNQKINEAISESEDNIVGFNKKTEENIIESNAKTEENIKTATEGLTLQNKILFITIATILIVVILGIVFSRTITRPIVNLKNIANDVVNGNMDAKFSVSTTDEIRDLTVAMEALVSSLRFFRTESEKQAGNNPSVTAQPPQPQPALQPQQSTGQQGQVQQSGGQTQQTPQPVGQGQPSQEKTQQSSDQGQGLQSPPSGNNSSLNSDSELNR